MAITSDEGEDVHGGMMEPDSKSTCLEVNSRVSEDCISRLPDDILVSVLSRLDDIEQQARTSLLARRWRTLWRYTIHFRFSLTCDDRYLWEHPNTLRKFIERVNQAVVLYLGSNFEEFSVSIVPMTNTRQYQSDFDGWLRFAFQKSFKRVKFHTCSPLPPIPPDHHYHLTAGVISNSRVDSLTSLHLINVGVTGEVLEHFLSVCPSLEDLSVSYSNTLVDFTVTGPSLKLKYLEIHSCSRLERLCIRDINLMSLKYCGRANTVTIGNTPHLLKVNFRVYTDRMEKMIPQIVSQLPQLETLEIVFLYFSFAPFLQFPLLRNLRELKLALTRANFSSSCSLCANLLVASPFLSKLLIEFRHYGDSDKEEEVRKLEHPHGCLKVVELSGFKGCLLDLGVALYIIENTRSLEKMIIDTNQIIDPQAIYQCEIATPDMKQSARALAKEKLETRLPQSAHLLVK